ncbi:MAG: polysaccharide deacetylase family protein [Gemmatimonadaceae bacterium]
MSVSSIEFHQKKAQDLPAERAPLVRSDGRLTRRLKTLLGHLLYRTGLYRRFWRDQAVIVLFHRIDDRYGDDPITSTRDRFKAFCNFFSRYFTIVGLSDLLRLLREGADISRHLVITFDDGYRDNREVAAEYLRERGMPACFFVATGFIGTDETVWWDALRRIRSEWMTWDDVRALRDAGFEIGAHTVTHPDLGVIAGEDARREIFGSKTRVEAELGAPVRHFAYPFGEADQITEANRMLVRDAGLISCLSAHGGCVQPKDDPLRLHRVPVNNWYLSPYQLGFETLFRNPKAARPVMVPRPVTSAT